MKIAFVSTYRTPCGVAKYLEELCNSLIKFADLKIFAEKTDKELEKINPNIDIPCERHYIRGGSYDETFQAIAVYKPDIVHIQFESSMYQENYQPNSAYLQFLLNLHNAGLKTIMTFHNILPKPNFTNLEVSTIEQWYNNLDSKVILCNEMVKKEFLKWAPNKEAYAIPLGSTIFTPFPKQEACRKLGLDENIFYIVQPGFYGMDKGMVQLVQALPKIVEKYPKAKVIFAGGLHPYAPDAWRQHTKDCIKEILKRKLEKNVMLLGRYIPEDELNLWLGAADVISLNYHWVSGLYSASASTHRLLCCDRPIVMNIQDVRLSEFQNDINCCKTTDENYAFEILRCYENKDYANKISNGANEYAQLTSFDKIAEKHLEVYNEGGNS